MLWFSILDIISTMSQSIRKKLSICILPPDPCSMYLFLLGPICKEVNMIYSPHLIDASQRNNESLQKQIISFRNVWKSALKTRATATTMATSTTTTGDQCATCQALCWPLHFHYLLNFTTALWGWSYPAPSTLLFTDDVHKDKYPAQGDRRRIIWNSNLAPFNTKAWATEPPWQAQGDRKNAAGVSTIRKKTPQNETTTTGKKLLSSKEWEKGLGYSRIISFYSWKKE